MVLGRGGVRRFTFADLDAEVGRLAAALRSLGVREGDRCACYMPMLVEVVVAMLATQKIGGVFVPIFSGYAPPAVADTAPMPAMAPALSCMRGATRATRCDGNWQKPSCARSARSTARRRSCSSTICQRRASRSCASSDRARAARPRVPAAMRAIGSRRRPALHMRRARDGKHRDPRGEECAGRRRNRPA